MEMFNLKSTIKVSNTNLESSNKAATIDDSIYQIIL